MGLETRLRAHALHWFSCNVLTIAYCLPELYRPSNNQLGIVHPELALGSGSSLKLWTPSIVQDLTCT